MSASLLSHKPTGFLLCIIAFDPGPTCQPHCFSMQPHLGPLNHKKKMVKLTCGPKAASTVQRKKMVGLYFVRQQVNDPEYWGSLKWAQYLVGLCLLGISPKCWWVWEFYSVFFCCLLGLHIISYALLTPLSHNSLGTEERGPPFLICCHILWMTENLY
jgi:hypothetical protein